MILVSEVEETITRKEIKILNDAENTVKVDKSKELFNIEDHCTTDCLTITIYDVSNKHSLIGNTNLYLGILTLNALHADSDADTDLGWLLICLGYSSLVVRLAPF